MRRKLTTEERAMAMAWFRKNKLPLLQTDKNNVSFHVEEEVDDNGKIQFIATVLEVKEVVVPTKRAAP
jgi:hypothetical protein